MKFVVPVTNLLALANWRGGVTVTCEPLSLPSQSKQHLQRLIRHVDQPQTRFTPSHLSGYLQSWLLKPVEHKLLPVAAILTSLNLLNRFCEEV